MTEGLLDTNVFVHAHTTDAFSAECRGFLDGLADGRVRAHLDPLVLHELTYALPRYVKGMTREQLARYALMVLGWTGVDGDKDVMADTLGRWTSSPRLAFVDAYLAALARRRGCGIFSKNVRELTGQGIAVPNPLPSSAPEPPALSQEPATDDGRSGG